MDWQGLAGGSPDLSDEGQVLPLALLFAFHRPSACLKFCFLPRTNWGLLGGQGCALWRKYSTREKGTFFFMKRSPETKPSTSCGLQGFPVSQQNGEWKVLAEVPPHSEGFSRACLFRLWSLFINSQPSMAVAGLLTQWDAGQVAFLETQVILSSASLSLPPS